MYYIKMSYKNEYRLTGTRPIEKAPFKINVEKVSIANEEVDRFHLNETEDGPNPRSLVVYKTDEEDVLSCGYAVLDAPIWFEVGLFEGYGEMYSLNQKEAVEALKAKYADLLDYYIDSYSEIKKRLNEI